MIKLLPFSSNLFPLKTLTICLLSGLLMGFTVAPTNLWWLGWLAPTTLWVVLNLNSNNRSISLLSAFLWGFAYHGFALFWITGIHPLTWMGVSWWCSISIALFCWLFITIWGASLVVIWAYLTHSFILKQKRSYSWLNSPIVSIVTAVSLWCLLEKIWSFSSLWWTSISFTQSPENLFFLQLLKLSGSTTITGLILLVNFLNAQFIINFLQSKKGGFNRYLLSGLTILLISHLLGFISYQNNVVDDSQKKVKVGLIQGNIPNEIKLYDPGLATAMKNYSRGYQDLAKQDVDLIITPETALPFFFESIQNNSPFYPLIKKEQVPILLGAFKKIDQTHYKNSLFVVDGEGNVIDRYDKIKLVPLGEYVPFNKILGGIISRLSPLDTYLIAGESQQSINTTIGKVVIGICYDSAFSEVFRSQTLQGGQFIVTSSNNAHYSDTMPTQHHAQDVMRAIENDRWLARVSNTGYSGVINPRGDTIWISQLNQYQIHEDEIYTNQNLTFFVKYGDWLSVLMTLYLLIYGYFSIAR